jgi:hypothetical protein
VPRRRQLGICSKNVVAPKADVRAKNLPTDSSPNAANRQSDRVDKPTTDVENTGRFLPVGGTIVPPPVALNGRGQISLLSVAPLSHRQEWSAHGCDQNFRPRRPAGLRFNGKESTSPRRSDIERKTATRVFLGSTEMVRDVGPRNFRCGNELPAPDTGPNGSDRVSGEVETPTA